MYLEQLAVHKDNKLAGLYPVTKLEIALIFFIAAGVLGSITAPFEGYAVALYFGTLIPFILAALSGVFLKYLKFMKVIAILALIIIVIQALVVRSPGNGAEGEALIQGALFGLHPAIWKYGLANGLKFGFMVLSGAGIFVWVFQTTTNAELIRSLQNSGLSDHAAYMFMASLQMVGALKKRSDTILNAQRARGVETEGNVIIRTKALLPSLIPLIVGSIIDTEERVLTMESKGFNIKCEKTHILSVEKNGYETAALIIALVYLAAAVVWRILS